MVCVAEKVKISPTRRVYFDESFGSIISVEVRLIFDSTKEIVGGVAATSPE